MKNCQIGSIMFVAIITSPPACLLSAWKMHISLFFFSVKFIIDVSYKFHCFSITHLFLVVYHNKEPN